MAPVLEQSLPTFSEFAARHGYDVVVGADPAPPGRSPAWAKVPMIRSLLDRYEAVLWIDADAIILDGSADPMEVFDPLCYQALVRHRWLHYDQPCTGVWLLRRDERALGFLDALLAYDGPYRTQHPWEQAAAMLLLGYESVDPGRLGTPTDWMAGTQWLDEEWDRIPILEPGRRLAPCRIRHYAAVPNTIRRSQMRADRHELAARAASGPRRHWHRAAAALGRARWRFVYAPELPARLRRLAGTGVLRRLPGSRRTDR